MIDDLAKAHLHDHLRWVREALVWKLDGLSEYDLRRPLTRTGTNLLGLPILRGGLRPALSGAATPLERRVGARCRSLGD